MGDGDPDKKLDTSVSGLESGMHGEDVRRVNNDRELRGRSSSAKVAWMNGTRRILGRPNPSLEVCAFTLVGRPEIG